MGKLHSKLSSKCRQSPEGGVLASNVLNSQREVEVVTTNKEKLWSMNMHRDVQRNNCLLEVTLPPEQGLNKSKQSNNEHIHSADQQRSTLTDNPKQEWLFTTESGNSSKEDMSNFLHGVYEAIDASVKPATDNTTTLKIKIVLSSSDDQHKEKKQRTPEETGRPRLYCVGENIERRNHYLDLAGIENFTSKFDDDESTYQKRSSHHHHLVATSDNCTQKDFQSFSTHNCQRITPVWKEERSSRLHETHPASLSRHQFSSFKHVTNGAVHRSHSKRLRHPTSPRRPVCCHNQGGKATPQLLSPCSPLVRHDHHHLHEHHHHHHHHYHAA